MPDDKPTAAQASALDHVIIVDLADGVRETQIRAMSRALARVLVAQSLIEHGIKPANDNE